MSAPRVRPAGQGSGQSGSLARPSLKVVQWGFRSGGGETLAASDEAPAGRPLILRFTLDGDQTALDEMRAQGRIAIEVQWTRETSTGAWGAPNLVTRLSIGHRGLASALAAEVRRTGFFEWHGWAEKTALSPGTWSVSLTYPDGTPLTCGTPPSPCRLSIRVG